MTAVKIKIRYWMQKVGKSMILLIPKIKMSGISLSSNLKRKILSRLRSPNLVQMKLKLLFTDISQFLAFCFSKCRKPTKCWFQRYSFIFVRIKFLKRHISNIDSLYFLYCNRSVFNCVMLAKLLLSSYFC